MEVPLDGAHGASQGFGQGLHLGPAQTRFVVAVVAEGTICRDCLGGDSGEDEGLYLRDTRKLGLLRHRPPPISSAAVRFDDKIHQSGGHPVKDVSAAFSMLFFTGAYFTYTGILALAPEHGPPPPHWRDLYSPPAAGQVRRRNPSMTIIGRIIGAVILIALFMAIVVVLARLGF